MTEKSPAKKSPVKRFAPLIVIAVIAALFFGFGGHNYVNLDALREHKDTLAAFVENNYFLAALGFMAAYALLTSICFPGAWILSLLGGFLFGTLIGGGLVVVGATLGATALFFAARFAIGDWLKEKAGSKMLQKFEKGLQENELSYLFILRLIPVFPFFIVNIAPAFFNVKIRNYILSTFFGIIPGSLVYASVGNGLGAILEGDSEQKLSGLMFQPKVIIPILLLIALSLVPIIYKKIKGSPAEPA